MRASVFYFALLAGQMNTLQQRTVVRLQPHQDVIKTEFGGKLVELINAPAVIQLPKLPPKQDSLGEPWSIEVRNLGPGKVTVVGNRLFSVLINAGQTAQIMSNGLNYSSAK